MTRKESESSNPTTLRPKDFWDKVEVISKVFVPIVVVLSAAYLRNSVNVAIKDKDVRIRTVELAVDILRQDPKQQSDIPGLRQWAINVIDGYSGIPFPAATRQGLEDSALPVSISFEQTLEQFVTSQDTNLKLVSSVGLLDSSTWKYSYEITNLGTQNVFVKLGDLMMGWIPPNDRSLMSTVSVGSPVTRRIQLQYGRNSAEDVTVFLPQDSQAQ